MKNINEYLINKTTKEVIENMAAMNDQDFLKAVVDKFAEKYPRRHIELREEDREHACVYIDGQAKYCTTGYNLLYNISRLCKALEDELL